MSHTTATPFVHLSERMPQMTGSEILQSLRPPPQFSRATFESYRADPEYPSQEEAKTQLMRFAGLGEAPGRKGLFARSKKVDPLKPGVYLDGGFGVGKTHLLAAIYRALPVRRKYFGSFIEYTALVGALGYRNAVDLLRGAELLCIDEFELDDPGDTMMMTRLLGELRASGTRFAATSNTPPNALGEGRFAAQDFLREIHKMAEYFQTIRIDGVDYRHRALDGQARVHGEAEYLQALVDAASGGAASDDSFDDLIGHLARVHPSRYIRLISGLAAIGLREVHTLDDQSAALRLVAFVDRAYDAQLPIVATGTELNRVFGDEMLAGGFRKKYLRAISRLIALSHA